MKKEINKKTRCSGCESDGLLQSEYSTHNTPMSFNNMKYDSGKNIMQLFSGCRWRDDSRCHDVCRRSDGRRWIDLWPWCNCDLGCTSANLSLFNAAVESDDALVISASDSKGNEVTMLTKITSYKFEKGVLTLGLSRMGLRANSGDKAATQILREFNSGDYSDVKVAASWFYFDPSVPTVFDKYATTKIYLPQFVGYSKKGKDGKQMVAFKAGKKKALQYNTKTGVVSSMDVDEVLLSNKVFSVSVNQPPASALFIILETLKKVDGDIWLGILTDAEGFSDGVVQISVLSIGRLVNTTKISKEEVANAIENWAKGLFEIGAEFQANGYAKARVVAEKFIIDTYNYQQDEGTAFKPTVADQSDSWRNTFDEALSYFVGGDPEYTTDKGFALAGWNFMEKKAEAEIPSCDTYTWCGKVTLKDNNGNTAVVDKTWVFRKDGNGKVRITLHHSSLPYTR